MILAHYVHCTICGGRFDRDTVPWVKVGNRRYAHQTCHVMSQIEESEQEKADREKLEAYIKKLFGTQEVSAVIKKQIATFITEKKYSYSGILKTLIYFYEVKHGDLSKSHGAIGIVPYVYDDAYNYYYEIWRTQQENSRIIQEEDEIIIPTREIKIRSPQRKPMGLRRNHFKFLDELLEGDEDAE